jgi:hypothetical protein
VPWPTQRITTIKAKEGRKNRAIARNLNKKAKKLSKRKLKRLDRSPEKIEANM